MNGKFKREGRRFIFVVINEVNDVHVEGGGEGDDEAVNLVIGDPNI